LPVSFWTLFLTIGAAAGQLSGVPRISDGDADTFYVDGVKIRLAGIDAPETDQLCMGREATRWTCSIDARDRLSEHIHGRSIDCTTNGKDRLDRTLAVCSVEGQELNAWLVREGWALAYIRYSSLRRT
jgi:endonuclease YncB( thermonuclease family)